MNHVKKIMYPHFFNFGATNKIGKRSDSMRIESCYKQKVI